MPTGGPKDTTAPELKRATPQLNARNVTGNKVTLEFNEYVEVQDPLQNVFVSPLQKNGIQIERSLNTVIVRFKDTMKPNTTYSINFGDAIRDVHEGNIYRDFTYVFSTGNTIDSLSLSGNVFMAETSLADSTMSVALYRNRPDSAAKTLRPDIVHLG